MRAAHRIFNIFISVFLFSIFAHSTSCSSLFLFLHFIQFRFTAIHIQRGANDDDGDDGVREREAE